MSFEQSRFWRRCVAVLAVAVLVAAGCGGTQENGPGKNGPEKGPEIGPGVSAGEQPAGEQGTIAVDLVVREPEGGPKQVVAIAGGNEIPIDTQAAGPPETLRAWLETARKERVDAGATPKAVVTGAEPGRIDDAALVAVGRAFAWAGFKRNEVEWRFGPAGEAEPMPAGAPAGSGEEEPTPPSPEPEPGTPPAGEPTPEPAESRELG